MKSAVVFVLSAAAVALASPTSIPIQRLERRDAPPFSCLSAFSSCLINEKYDGDNTGPAATICSQHVEACGKCALQESQCLSDAFTSTTDASGGPDCFGQSSLCYLDAWNPASTEGPYFDCGSALGLCDNQPFANHAFCASVAGQCGSCQKQEDACRTAPEANEAFCSSQARSCFADAVES